MAKWFVFLFLSLNSEAFANHFLNQHEDGWYWHNEPVELSKKEPKPTTTEANPDKTWKRIGNMVDQSRAQAILNPTVENITEARRMQRILVAQANLFSRRWMLDLLLHPEFDENLVNPNNNAGRGLYNEQQSVLKEQVIEQISETSGLLYFYKGGEAFSEKMAEVISDFSNRYHIPLIPIAMTPQFSPVFPNSQVDSGQAKQLNVKHIPAVFAMHPNSKQMMPVAFGLISQSELKDNLFMATKAFGGYDEK
jgi:conjugal transfer pilus assembly protein TraF